MIDNYHVVAFATKALDEVRREHWNELRATGDPGAAKTFKHSRWSLLKNPADLNDQQAATLAQIQAGGGKIARAWAMKEMVRAIFAPGLTVEAVNELLDRLLARLSRCRLKPFIRLGKTIRKHRDGILAARRLNLSNASAEAITTTSSSSFAAPSDSTPPRPRSRSFTSPADRSPSHSHTNKRSHDFTYDHARRARFRKLPSRPCSRRNPRTPRQLVSQSRQPIAGLSGKSVEARVGVHRTLPAHARQGRTTGAGEAVGV